MTTLTNIIGSEKGKEGRDNPICNPVELAAEVTKHLIEQDRQKEIEAKKAKLKQSEATLENKIEDNNSKVNLFSDCEIIVSPKYRVAMIDAENLAEEKNLIIANMPQLIQALTNPTIRKKVRPMRASTISAEYQGQNSNGDSIYVVAHGLGPLSYLQNLDLYLRSRDKTSGFMPIKSKDMKSVLQNAISLSDVRKGNIPQNQLYSIIINMDKDNPKIKERGQFSRENFLKDDRVLAVCGSLENRETLAKILFNSKGEGGEGYTSVVSNHIIPKYVSGLITKTSGRPLCLYSNNNGVNGFDNCGRFVLLVPDTYQSQNNNNNNISKNK